MGNPDHPARRPTRYHWAAGTHMGHLSGLGAGLLATIASSVMAAQGLPVMMAIASWLALGTVGWSLWWLLVVPNNPRFRRAIDAKLKALHENDFEYQYSELIEEISIDLRNHAASVQVLRNRARKILVDKFGDHDPFAKDNLEKLDRLAISYLQLLSALTEYQQYHELVDPVGIEREIFEVSRGGNENEDKVIAEARQRQSVLLKNRLERYRKVEKRIELVKAQLRNVETTLKLLVDQAMTTASPERVSRDIDQVLSNIEESEILAAELSAYDDMSRELDDYRMRNREIE